MSLALLGWVASTIASKDGLSTLGARVSQLRPEWFALVVALHFAAIGLGIVRWQTLLYASRIPLPMGWLARSYLVGRFIGAATPSTVGLDLTRTIHVAQRTGNRVGAATAVVIEKAVGLLGLAGACALLLPFGGVELLGSTALIVTAAIAVLAAVGLWALARATRWKAVLRRLPRASRLERLLEAVDQSQPGARVLTATTALSLMAHLGTAAVFVASARALRVEVDPAVAFVAGNAIVLATLLPISIGGIGVRESVAVAVFGAVGVSASDATLVALLGYLTGQIPTLVGAVFLTDFSAAAARPAAGASALQRSH